MASKPADKSVPLQYIAVIVGVSAIMGFFLLLGSDIRSDRPSGLPILGNTNPIVASEQSELCSDGLDNDGDGEIDCGGDCPYDCDTFFVDKGGVGGFACSGSGTGRISQPWCTIDKASNTLTAGQTVLVRAGVYAEPIIARNSGTSSAYITYKNFGEESVIINPTADLPSGTVINGIPDDGRQSRGVYLLNVQYNHVEGFKFHSPGRWLWANRAYNNIIKGNSFVGATASGGSTSGLYFFESSYNVVEDNYLEQPGRNYAGGDSVVFEKADANVVEGNTFMGAGHANFAIRCSNMNIIRDNYFENHYNKIGEVYDSCSFGPGCVTERNLIEDNVFAYTGTDGDNSPESGVQYAGQRGIIRGNVFYDNFAGFLFALYPGSVCTPPVYEAFQNFENRFYNNVLHANRHSGVILSQVQANSQFYDNILKNNVFYKNTFTTENTGITWWNTLVGKPIQVKPERLSDFVFERNDVFNSFAGEDYVIVAGARSPLINPPNHPLSWWESNYPDVFMDNIEADPAFTDAANHDYRLAGNSPMIDAGAFLTKALGSGSGNQMHVEDAGYFFDGFGIPGEVGDSIQLEGQPQQAVITDVDYTNNIITLDRFLTWSDGQGVSLAYSGSKPDLGAYEYVQQGCTQNSDCLDSNLCTYDLCKDSVCVNNNANLDGGVNIGLGDIIQVIAHWATAGPTGDVDSNGNVGLSDVLAVISLWSNTC